MAEITFDTGARVILRGPAEFTVGDVENHIENDGKHAAGVVFNSGYLARGKLTARVDTKEAMHFSIRTRTTLVKDLGTEFEVDVDPRGITTAFVFEGRVEIAGIVSNDSTITRILSAGEGCEFDASGIYKGPAEPRGQRFAAAASQLDSTKGRLLIYEPFLSGDNPELGEYSAGARLDGANAQVARFAASWSDPVDRLDTTAIGLQYELIDQGMTIGVGGSVVRRADGGGTGAVSYAREIEGLTISNPGELWFAFLVNAASIGNEEVLSASFAFDADVGPRNGARAGIAGPQFVLHGERFGRVSAGRTNLFVGQLSVTQTGTSGKGDEVIRYWVNPTDTRNRESLDATAELSHSVAGNFAFGEWGPASVRIIAGGQVGSKNQIDEIMIAGSLEELNQHFDKQR
ncbi:MAG: FecR family protein [Pirellulales bacterium]|nr:FecR family protein [Pirellulales bacterium]